MILCSNVKNLQTLPHFAKVIFLFLFCVLIVFIMIQTFAFVGFMKRISTKILFVVLGGHVINLILRTIQSPSSLSCRALYCITFLELSSSARV